MVDFVAVRQFLADVDAAADKGVENSKRNATAIHKVVAEALTLVDTLEASGAVDSIVNTVTNLFTNKSGGSTRSKVDDMADWLAKNNDTWKVLSKDQVRQMAQNFPDTVERLYQEAKRRSAGGSTDNWGNSTDTP